MKPNIPRTIADVLSVMDLSSEGKAIPDTGGPAGWKRYMLLRSDGSEPPVPVLLIEHKAKSIPDAKRQISGSSYCVALFHLKSSWHLYFKAGSKSAVFGLDSGDAHDQILAVLSSVNFAAAITKVRASLAIMKAIQDIPTATKNFNNRGVFSTHYLKSRLLDSNGPVSDDLNAVWDGDALKSLNLLGWTDLKGGGGGIYHSQSPTLATILVVEKELDFGMQRGAGEVAPSYRAIAELRRTPWVILTDGITWRLYTSRVSASTTNYFEINLGVRKDIILRYLVAIFGATLYVGPDDKAGKAGIDVIFDEGKNYVQELEENLADRILKPDGVFVDLVKGILDHNGRRKYTHEDLQEAKKTALKIMYRLWFLMYAESRDLLPVKDQKYTPLS